MKKLILPFLILTVFLFKIDNVEAITGGYTYDITSVTLGSDGGAEYIKILGWAYINDSSGNTIHNINPTFSLVLTGVNNLGAVKYTKSYTTNYGTRPAYNLATSTPNDFTKAYFTKGSVGGTYYTYPESGASRADVIAKMMNVSPYYNKFAININFEFRIPIQDYVTMYKQGATRSKMDLNVTVGKGPYTVYGKSGFSNTNTFNKTIPAIGIQRNRINNGGSNTIYAPKAKVLITFYGLVNSVYVVATYGQSRPHWSLDWYNYYYYYQNQLQIIHLYDKPADAKSTYYYNLNTHGAGKALYTLTGQQMSDIGLKAANVPVYSYEVRISPTKDNCWGGYCVANGGEFEAWIPSFWVVPVTGRGLGDFPCPDCEPGTVITIEIPQTCVDKTECKSLGSGTTCPKSTCCNEICSIAANQSSYFCKQVCNPEPPKIDPCDYPDDAQKQYCCKYPSDKTVCDSKTGTFPELDPVNKPGTCKTSGSTDVSFKYPEEGWGEKILSNNACTISCSEKLKATFQSSRSVRAGMGWEYPVTINSSRYCTANYDNDGWEEKNNDAALAANDSYEQMVEYIDEAKDLDDACGTKYTLEEEPECDSDCADRRKGTCIDCDYETRSCTKCGSYYESCPTKYNPSRECKRCETCTLQRNESVDCPSGYSYRSSIDACARDVCSEDYDTKWTTGQSRIDNALDDADRARSDYNKYVSTVNKLNTERTTCDNYVSDKRYSGATGTEIDATSVPNQTQYDITSSTRSEDSSYEKARKKTASNYTVYECKSIKYTAPTLVGDHKSRIKGYTGTYCNYQPTTKSYYDFWNKKSDAKVDLEFNTEYYVQRYTGSLSTYSSSGYEYDGRKSYTGFYDMSARNTFRLRVIDIGPNLQGVSNDLWSINPFTCNYRVDNLIFPPKGDPNNDLYGNVAFMYRQVSLTDPFPGRSPGENWDGYSSLITSKGYKVYSNTPLYTINLSPTEMQNIRGYGTNYGSYYASDPYRSIMVENYIKSGIIKKGK